MTPDDKLLLLKDIETGDQFYVDREMYEQCKPKLKGKSLKGTVIVIGTGGGMSGNSEELRNIEVIGPSEKGARLEGSKDYAKEFMAKNKVPTARYRTFTKDNLAEAKRFLKEWGM